VRAVLRHQILEGPTVVEAGKLIVGHVDLEGVPSWTAVTDAQSRRAGSPLREQLHRERADRLEAALEEEERSKVRGTLEAQSSKGFLAAALPRPSSSRSRVGTGFARGACARTSGSSAPRTP
jgi:hypothetical protein